MSGSGKLDNPLDTTPAPKEDGPATTTVPDDKGAPNTDQAPAAADATTPTE